MLKLQTILNLGVGGLLLVPTVVLRGTQDSELEGALNRTLAALDRLSGIRAALQAGEPGAVDGILEATEGPIPAGVERDAHLTSLRQDIGRLAGELERLEVRPTGASTAAGAPAPVGPNTMRAVDPDSATSEGEVHTGLAPAERRALEGIRPPVAIAMGTQRARSETVSMEPDDFVVDPVKLGRSYYLAERWAEGLEILARCQDDPEGRYWLARCLEKLGRVDEAIAAYQAVTEHSEQTYLTDRARNDLEFLRWKREFERRVGERKETAR